MLKLKKTAVAVLALGSSAVFAGTMGPVCAPGNVTIPCEKTAWDFGARALYLEAVYSDDLGHANVVTNSTTNADVLYPEPKWGWGFMVEGSYHFNTGNDLNLNWWHYSKRANRSWPNGTYVGAYYIDPAWDAVNIELGQQVDFSDMKHVRVHVGAQYSRQHTDYRFTQSPFTVTQGLTYNGFGPRLGADMTYELGNGFGVYGNGAMALLIGSSKSVTSGYTGSSAASNLGTHKTAMVPELEAKLGAKYDYAMPQGDLGFDLGYLWANYFTSQIAHASYTAASNFAVHGPYFGLKWVGNV